MKQLDKTMTKLSLHILVLMGLCGFAIAKSLYLISAPNLIRPGMTYGMTISILNAKGNVQIKATLVLSSTNKVITSKTGTITKGKPSREFHLKVPSNLSPGQYVIKVKGSGALSFSRQTSVSFRDKDVLILIQTDKAMYSENQRVRLRVVTMYPNMNPYKGSLNIKIYDSKNTLIQQWMAVDSKDGVFVTNFLINTDPSLGQWKIKVSAKGQSTVKEISVKRYVLPKFNVDVKAGPNYIINSGVPLVAKINASYTFGKPVHGTAVVQFIEYPRKKLIKQFHVDVHGTGQTSLPSNKIPTGAADIVVVAQVGETTSGTTVIGSTTVNIIKAFKLTFGPTRKAFSPGLPYTTFVKVSSAVGANINQNDKLSVRIDITNVQIKRCSDNIRYFKKITHTKRVQSIAVGKNRTPKITVSTPTTATSIKLSVTLKGIKEVLFINADFTKSKKHIQIIPKAPSAQVGNRYNMNIKLSHTLNGGRIIYQVISRGVQVQGGSVMCTGRKTIPLAIKVTSAFVPKAHILVYAVYNKEIVVDGIDIDVSGSISVQKIHLNFEKKVVKPGQPVKLKIRGSPKSKVHVLAVDESVHILQSGYDISVADVVHKLQSFDTIPAGYSKDFITKRSQNEQKLFMKKSLSSPDINDADDIFRSSGMNIMSNAYLYDYDVSERNRILRMKTHCKKPVVRRRFHSWLYNRYRITPSKQPSTNNLPSDNGFAFLPDIASIAGPLIDKATSSTNNLPMDKALMLGPGSIGNKFIKPKPKKTSVKITLLKHQYTRKLFQETWIFETFSLSNKGSYTLMKPIPDTITSWRASAFSVENGFGITDSVAKITTYLPLFVDLKLPYKVVKNEKVAVKVSIYNYQPLTAMLLIRVWQSADPGLIVALSAQIKPGSSAMKYFTLNAIESGVSNVTVSVVDMFTFMEVDKLQKPMIIKNEGIEREYNKQHMISVSKDSTYTERFDVKLPPGYVTGSKRVYVTVSGDVNAPTIANLGHLLNRPCGCGEQTIITLAPNIFATKYLTLTKQLKPSFKRKAIEHMIYGRENELRWQRVDGSFSAWGNGDSSGSMWITAFVAMSFQQAKQFINIEKSILTRALDWIFRYQNSDGSFREPGRVIHVNMQGGSRSSKIAFTAYILMCIMEVDDIPEYKQKIDTAANKAKRYIERRTSSITQNHALSICAYALRLVNSKEARSIFKKLELSAINKGKIRYWNSNVGQSRKARWVSPNPRARPIDIETAGFALLYYSLEKNYEGGINVLRWLITQRNPNGGFQSTQDTVVALHAMAEFSALFFQSTGSSSNHMVNIDITGGNHQATLTVNNINKLQLQRENLPNNTSAVTMRATGSGLVLVDICVQYNIYQNTEEPAYKISTQITKETFDSIVVKVCSRRTKPGKSGMVVQEITLPSGFKADLSSIKNVRGLTQKEANFDKVDLYFNSMDQSDVCLDMKADRVDKVIQSQTYPIEIYDYYDPRNQGIGNYTSGKLKNTKLCDVCPTCYVCTHDSVWG